MKKIISTVLSILLLSSLIPYGDTLNAKADDQTNLTLDQATVLLEKDNPELLLLDKKIQFKIPKKGFRKTIC